MPKYVVMTTPFAREGAPYCVTTYDDALPLGIHLIRKKVAIGLDLRPNSVGMIHFPINGPDVPTLQSYVDEWIRARPAAG